MIDKSVSTPDRARDGWFTSSYTNGTGACVEIKFGQGAVVVRDTKNRLPVIAMTPAGWISFVNTVTA
jgi:uncharacterized protein DUF397